MHPLSPNLSGLTEDELHKKRADLAARMMYAYRAGNTDMIYQLQMLIGDYDSEVQARNQKLMAELEKNKNYKDKIDIK